MLDLTGILEQAAQAGASDVLITVGASPRIRVHGKLVATNFPKVTMSETLETLLDVISVDQRAVFEAEGELDLSVSLKDLGRYRVNAYKQRGCISLAFRLVDSEIPSLEDLGAPESVIRLCERQRGLVIVCGPSGSGKSTMLAAMLDKINETRDGNIITLEDPIEYLHQHKRCLVNQREVGLDTGSYSKGLKAALREDPDVIHIDVLESSDVVSDVFMAVETGKLVLTSMHTSGCIDTLQALIAMFPAELQEQARIRLAGSLKAIVSRQLCEGTGEGELVPVYGILFGRGKVRQLIREGRYEEIRRMMTQGEEGMTGMDASLFFLWKAGRISEKEALTCALDQDTMAGWLRSARAAAQNSIDEQS